MEPENIGNGDEEFKDFLKRSSEVPSKNGFMLDASLSKLRDIRKMLTPLVESYKDYPDGEMRNSLLDFSKKLMESYISALKSCDYAVFKEAEEGEIDDPT